MAYRVDDYVKGWIHRSYLRPYRWWAQLVLDEFAFLDEWGFRLDGSEMAGVHFHQNGNYIWFEGPHGYVVLEYDPEADGSISASINGRSLDAEIARHDPSVELMPPRLETKRPEIERKIKWWGAKLRELAPKVFVSGAREART